MASTTRQIASSVKVKVAQWCPTLCDCDPGDYTVHGILQARILEWVAFPFSRGSSQPRDRTQVSRITGRFFTSWATREAQPALSVRSTKYSRYEQSHSYPKYCGEWASQAALVIKNLPANAGGIEVWADCWVGKIPWRREWQPTLVFLLGESDVQKSLADYSPWIHKVLDTTEAT